MQEVALTQGTTSSVQSGPIAALLLLGHGQVAVAGGMDNSVRLFDVRNKKLKKVLP